MLVLTVESDGLVNFYQNTDDKQPRLLGSMKLLQTMKGRCRLGFEFATDVKIVRDEIDSLRPRDTEIEALYQDTGNPVA